MIVLDFAISSSMNLTESILSRCYELGFALAGVATARPTDRGREYLAWLKKGQHGEMSYLARNTALRIDVRKMVPGAASVICVADRYHDGSPDRHTDTEIGRIARYARGDDYHKVMKKRLISLCDELRAAHPEYMFRACVDTAPLLEREHAARAGLGAIGKHTLLIEQGVGSYLLLGEIITTLELEPTGEHSLTDDSFEDPCGSCTRCIDACPTDAITPWSVDATKCISYLTIEHCGEIDERFHEPIGNWIFGCDICQEVCPHNQPTRRSKRAEINPAYEPRRAGVDPLEILNWSQEDRREAFRGSAMKRANLDMMKRNALIVLSNVVMRDDQGDVRARLERLCNDVSVSEVVKETAKTVLARIT